MDNVKPRLTENQIAGLTDLIEVSRSNMDQMLRHRQEVMERLAPGMSIPEAELRAQSEQGMLDLEAAVAAGDLTEYLAKQREQTALAADQGLSFQVIGRALVELIQPVAGAITERFGDEPDRVMRALQALHDLETEFLLMAGEAYSSVREDNVESEFQAVVRRLSTPVIEVWDEILVMPLIGVLDTSRAKQMMEQLLERIVEEQAKFIIIDITGVPTVDTAVAEHLLKTTKAGHLVGASTLLVGISPQVAQTLVRLGVSLGDVATFTDLRSGLEHAFDSLGYDIQRRRG
ncbi:MAG: STAS domain-containing protein [Acidimicrobiia bacterium]